MTPAQPPAQPIEHGTVAGYRTCVKRREKSCPACRAAIRAHNVTRLANGSVEHGTRAGYQCCVQRREGACEPCQKAQQVYVAHYLTDPDIPINHGSRAGYRRCLTRPEGACEPCRTVHSTYLREWRTRQRQKAKPKNTRTPDAQKKQGDAS